MSADDYAVVIGVRRYRPTTPPWLGELNAPDDDAGAIAEWLTRRTGGGLPDSNVTMIRSADFPPERKMAPLQHEIEGAFADLATLDRSRFEGKHSGRRLYVYVSGHGFAENVADATLICADAGPRRPLNVVITSWVNWFYTACRFKEYVVWADCCRTRLPIATPKYCDLVPEYCDDPDSGKQFIAFAASYKKLAVENKFNGKWQGVFTYGLLQALNGAAVGELTTKSIADYLRENMASFLSDDQKRSSSVAKAPKIVEDDPITFSSPPTRPTFPVTLSFPPACIGKQAKVAVNNSSPPVAETQLDAPDWILRLETGIWCAFVPDKGLVQPFEIKGDGSNAVVTIS